MANDNHRLPRSGSAALWAHLLGKDQAVNSVESQSSIPVLPPLAPLDKNGTTMRVLLHDTQTNLENFSVQVNNLIKKVGETQQEIKQTSVLFEREHDSLVGDMIDLVNRSQTQIQKSLGEPAQASTVNNFFKSVDMRLEGLDHRLDAIQAFNQTHSQALHTQMQAIQTLQTQQTTILASVAPLLPLIQAIPLHLDAVKKTLHSLTSLNDLKTSSDSLASLEGPKISSTSPTRPKKRLHSERDDQDLTSSPNVSALQRKKSRLELPASAENLQIPSPPSLQRTLFPSRSPPNRTCATESNHGNSGHSETYTLKRKSTTSATPRQPLEEIPVVSAAKSLKTKQKPVHERGLNPPTIRPSSIASSLLGFTPSAQRASRILQEQSSSTGSKKGIHKLNSSSRKVPLNELESAAQERQPIHHPLMSALQDTLSSPSLLTVDPFSAMTASSKRANMPPPELKQQRTSIIPPNNTPSGNLSITRNSVKMVSASPFDRLRRNDLLYNMKSMNVKPKGRRSPIKEGRRFISLVDTDDEDEDD